VSIQELFESNAVVRKQKFSEWLDSLDESDRVAVLTWAASPNISTRKFHDIVASKNVGISREDLHKWRIEQGLKA